MKGQLGPGTSKPLTCKTVCIRARSDSHWISGCPLCGSDVLLAGNG